ncbi:hypothetical protein [Scytonema hofmannii]|nr:hypothetical protein [Scytonema hofmannii]
MTKKDNWNWKGIFLWTGEDARTTRSNFGHFSLDGLEARTTNSTKLIIL